MSSGESILVDVGTTTAALAHELVARTDLTDLTVITNGIKIALDLEAAYPRFSIVVTGGTLRPKQHSLVDPRAAVMLQTLNVDTVFLGCNGLDADAGVSNIDLPEAAIKRTMIAAAGRCIVLADSTKLGGAERSPRCAASTRSTSSSPTAAPTRNTWPHCARTGSTSSSPEATATRTRTTARPAPPQGHQHRTASRGRRHENGAADTTSDQW